MAVCEKSSSVGEDQLLTHDSHRFGDEAEEESEDEETKLKRLAEAKKALIEERRQAAAMKQAQKAEMEQKMKEVKAGAQKAQGKKQRDGKKSKTVVVEATDATKEVPTLSEEQMRLEKERQDQEKEAQAHAVAEAAANRRAMVDVQAEKNRLKQEERERAAQREEESRFVWGGGDLVKIKNDAVRDSLARSQDGVPKGLAQDLSRWLDRT